MLDYSTAAAVAAASPTTARRGTCASAWPRSHS